MSTDEANLIPQKQLNEIARKASTDIEGLIASIVQQSANATSMAMMESMRRGDRFFPGASLSLDIDRTLVQEIGLALASRRAVALHERIYGTDGLVQLTIRLLGREKEN